jgi:hypothetical protein
MMPETTRDVVVHHPGRLHVGVTDRASYEIEAARFEIFAHGVRFGGFGGKVLEGPEAVANRFSADETPNVGVEGSEFFLDL